MRNQGQGSGEDGGKGRRKVDTLGDGGIQVVVLSKSVGQVVGDQDSDGDLQGAVHPGSGHVSTGITLVGNVVCIIILEKWRRCERRIACFNVYVPVFCLFFFL